MLQFKYPFGISGNTRSETASVFIKLEEGGLAGFGEACLPAYHGETVEQTLEFFESAKPLLNAFFVSNNIQSLMESIDALHPGCNAAKAAIDIALNDLFSKRENKSFCAWKGIPKREGIFTSYTIGIDSEAVIIQKIKEAADFAILKIKAGTKNDRDLIRLIRKHTNKPLFIDVNQGWNNKEEVIRMIDWLCNKNVLLLEQPMPKNMNEDMKWVSARSVIPTFADESVKRLRDLEHMDGAFSGINIKLMKCTGLTEALKMTNYCKQNGIKILLGCMAESSCGTTAMAQLMPYADFVDLDAPLLYKNDPFTGVTYEEGKVLVNQMPGIGALPVADNLFT